MAKIFPGRCTADTDSPFVVFLIGMRINKPLALHKWVPTAMAMGPMLRSLYQNPDSGFLGGEPICYPGGVGIWHETYEVAAGHYEAICGNMPRFGLAGATAHVPVSKRGETAHERLTA